VQLLLGSSDSTSKRPTASSTRTSCPADKPSEYSTQILERNALSERFKSDPELVLAELNSGLGKSDECDLWSANIRVMAGTASGSRREPLQSVFVMKSVQNRLGHNLMTGRNAVSASLGLLITKLSVRLCLVTTQTRTY
jgi:hypothetical protein